MKSFLEAVIDIPRRTYAKGVFDDADTNNPKIKDSVKAQIDKQIEEFEKELTTQIMNRCSKAVSKLLRNKIRSYTAKRWMATERRLRRRK